MVAVVADQVALSALPMRSAWQRNACMHTMATRIPLKEKRYIFALMRAGHPCTEATFLVQTA